jgi:homoserine dehydrogenase
MGKSPIIDIALLGLGKLGHGIYQLWSERREHILSQTGIDLNIKCALVKHIDYRRGPFVPREIITDDLEQVLSDPAIKIVIDAMGGIEPTYGIIKQFLNKQCHIVSANRALLASKMREVFELARKQKVHLQFDAALGGGIPVIHTIRRDLVGSKITGIWGIASGSSNYILSEMAGSRRSLKEVLNLPKLKTLSESQMLLDYEGSDSAQKLVLLAATAFGIEVDYLQVYAEGISHIKKFDISTADEFGYQIKLLAILKDRRDGVEIRVHPTMVPNDHPLNSVRNDYSAVYLQTDTVGEFMLYGKGAGVMPAANMVLRDLVDVATTIKSSSKYMYELPVWNEKHILPMDEIRSKYYLRFLCVDQPGVMGKLATALGENEINIESAHASIKEIKRHQKVSFVHFFTEKAREKDIKQALKDIKKFRVIHGEIKMFRILGDI